MDYHLLHLGPASSLVSGVAIKHWGTEVRVECIYDPLGDQKTYSLLFSDCIRVVIDVLPDIDPNEQTAELIGISLGKPDSQMPAVVTTDLFEMAITYTEFQCIRTWS